MPNWTEEELSLLGWQWAGHAMLICDKNPQLWKEWVEYANANIDPTKTTDSKMGKALTKFVDERSQP